MCVDNNFYWFNYFVQDYAISCLPGIFLFETKQNLSIPSDRAVQPSTTDSMALLSAGD